MTVNLEKLSEALAGDTPEQVLKEKILANEQEIRRALSNGEDVVLDGGLVIAAG